jgi:peptidoglycan/xylan/chitin deacetylase (PgdA/CDA1 family)
MAFLGRLGMRPLLSVAYRGRRGMALAYHQVLGSDRGPSTTSTQITLQDFTAQLEFIASTCRVLPAGAFVEAMKAGRLPRRACLLTFDDGFEDNYGLAFPILRRLGLSATFFVASGYVAQGRPFELDAVHDVLRLAPAQTLVEVDCRPWGGPALSLPYASPGERFASYFRVTGLLKRQIRWPDRRAFVEYLADRFGVAVDLLRWPRMMSPEQLREMAEAGMTIGSHTEWHASLAAEGPDEFARQLQTSRRILEDMTGRPVRFFSYPFGDPEYCVAASGAVRESGYEAAFMACGLPSTCRLGPWLIDRQATSGGLVGLWASLLRIKPSQYRQGRALAECLRHSEQAGTANDAGGV